MTISTATPEQVKGALAMRGHTVRTLARDLGVSVQTVNSVIKRHATSARISEHIETLINHPPTTCVGPRTQ
jgi:lambda repressor-like predicted transcriptional regulator